MGIYQLTDRIIDPTRYPWGWEGVLWTPESITTALWLDAADSDTITRVSGAVSQWDDKSGNGNHFGQSTPGSRPGIGSLGGKDVLTFDGADDRLTLANTDIAKNAPALTAFIVQKYNAVSSQYSLHFDANDSHTSVRFSFFTGGNNNEQYILTVRRLDTDDATNCFTDSTAPFADTNWNILAGEADFASGGTSALKSWVNAVLDTQASLSGTGNTSDTVSQLAVIGDRRQDRFFNGSIAEIVLTRTILSIADRQKLEGYLAHKWGLTANLPSDHPYKTFAPRA